MEEDKDSRNETFEQNQAAIRDAVLALLKVHKGRRPTKKEICEQTGLSYPTVRKHLRELDKRGLGKKYRRDDVLRTLNDDVKLAVYRSAMAGNPAAAKLWFQLMEGFSEKTETKVEANVKVENTPPVVIHIE